MTRGYVYVLTNPAMPGLVKIGKTTRSVDGRASELYQTGVPMPFAVEDSVMSPDCAELERMAHEHFARDRVGSGREFFSVDPRKAVDAISRLLLIQVADWIGEFIPDHAIYNPDMVPDEADIIMMAGELDAHPYEVASAMGELSAAELMPALLRWRAKVNARTERRRFNLVVAK